ncbi:MarR family winged helix-turn-helix transcriptional regulator [Mycolicibacterium komossense]|uniref:MarR family transcriptional regulator n=1 Tax=Mycolicibacterium komossense TaxID=1779 RepID=A0ABT3C8J6_9MYCO|nr:MarR family transcriptional regulator [Mycolicibacterium komossense]MCV7225770.1 MarR family transcriptional regulator [Mycolicibacterium komossense]
MPAESDLEVDIGQLAGALFVSVGLVRRRLRQQQVAGDLSFPETAALARLDRDGPATSAELARQEQISPQSMGATLGALQDRGLIARSADPDDGRRVVLTMTEGGRTALQNRRRARVEQLAQGLVGFTAEELAALQTAAPLIERLAQQL